ncbi:MAG: TIGR02221 family CRISPR-associated protein, partial [Chloracidobacterium sp.]|nr:TIGR02221 family CRISPR-associated protein [Chloracidobacterium sp.]
QVRKQFRLLQWYVEKRLPLQALLLAREWTISALCLLAGYDDYLERAHRQDVEGQLGAMIGYGERPGLDQPIAAYVPDAKKLADFWSRLTEYRNDLAHVQMRKNFLNSGTLENFALNDLPPTLQALFPSFCQ